MHEGADVRSAGPDLSADDPPGAPGAIVVVNYGSSDLIRANLTESAVTASGCRVVLVDNFSTAQERAAAGALCDERGWHLVASERNEGFGAGVNRGVEAAIERGASVFIALNPDAVAAGDVVAALVADVSADPSRLAAPLIVTPSGRIEFRGSQVSVRTGRIRTGWKHGDDDPEWKNWLSGACLAFSRRVFETLGGMSEDYFLYWEDVDFSRRAAVAGFVLDVRRDLQVVHDEGGTQGQRRGRGKSPLYYFYNTRNRLLFAARLFPGARTSFLASTPAESYRIWLRGGRRQAFAQPGGILAAVRGTLAGVRATLRRPRAEVASPNLRRSVLVTHPSPDLYGSDRVLLESVAGLVESGRRVVVALPADGPLVPELVRHGAEVRTCGTPVLRKSALSPRGFVALAGEAARALPRARRLVRELAPDMVLVNTITTPVWLLVARGGGRTVVCHVHEAERSARPLVRKGLYAPLFLAHKLVVNSHFALGVIADTWPALAARSEIVANGVPGPPAPSAPRASLSDEMRILFIGRLSPRKGPQVAIEALTLLRREGIPAHLSLLGAIFPGYEWFEQQLRMQVAEAGLTDHVTFLGFHPNIWRHIADSDVVCVPSTVDEPFGNTAVEAMLAQRPLVVSATSGLLEAADGYATAWRVPPEDPERLAEALADVADHWTDVVGQVADDRELALSRHAPKVYRRALVDTLVAGRANNRPARSNSS